MLDNILDNDNNNLYKTELRPADMKMHTHTNIFKICDRNWVVSFPYSQYGHNHGFHDRPMLYLEMSCIMPDIRDWFSIHHALQCMSLDLLELKMNKRWFSSPSTHVYTTATQFVVTGRLRRSVKSIMLWPDARRRVRLCLMWRTLLVEMFYLWWSCWCWSRVLFKFQFFSF